MLLAPPRSNLFPVILKYLILIFGLSLFAGLAIFLAIFCSGKILPKILQVFLSVLDDSIVEIRVVVTLAGVADNRQGIT